MACIKHSMNGPLALLLAGGQGGGGGMVGGKRELGRWEGRGTGGLTKIVIFCFTIYCVQLSVVCREMVRLGACVDYISVCLSAL